MKLETLRHLMRIDELESKLKSETDLDSVISVKNVSDSQFLVKVIITNFFDRMDIVIDRRICLIGDLLSLELNVGSSDCESARLNRADKIVEDHIIESIKLYNTEIESGNDTVIAKIEEFHSMIKEFNFESNLYHIEVVDDALKLHVPKMHPHQKDRYFTIAKISEHSYEDLIFIVKTQIQAIDFYDELLCREDLLDVRFNLSKSRHTTLDVILNDDEYQYGKVRVRMSCPDLIEVEYSIYSVVVNSEYVKISDMQSQIFHRVSSNDDYEKRDFLIETATSQRCLLKDFHRTLEDVKFRLKDRIIRIAPMTD